MLQCRVVSAASSPAGSFPDRVGKYELLLPLGTGGTATVYLAPTRGVAGFEREVALKLVHAHLRADEESRLHLLEEARLAARIRHPNVVSVTEVDADACGVFLVMDYVEGETLSGLVRVLRDQGHRLPSRLIARIMNDSLAGLHAAHELRDKSGELSGRFVLEWRDAVIRVRGNAKCCLRGRDRRT
jgi:serine/threonine-protein kinase